MAVREDSRGRPWGDYFPDCGNQRRTTLHSQSLDLFCSIYGAEAGNLVLKTMAVGGVRVGGGIAPQILVALEKGGFVQAFRDKGRFADLLKNVEIAVVLNSRAPLIGAAQYALRL